MTKLIDQNPNTDLSFHPTPNQQTSILSTVIENECSEATSTKDFQERVKDSTKKDDTLIPNENEPIRDQIPCISSTDELMSDPVSLLNMSVNIDHTEKKILFEVNETTGVDITVFDVPTPHMSMVPNTTQGANVSKSDSFDVETGGNLEANSQEEPLNQTKLTGDMLSDTTMMNSPPFMRNTPDEHVRTPIGKLLFRKVALSNRLEDTHYAVEVVQKVRKSHGILPETPSYGMGYDDDCDVNETLKSKAYPLLRSAPIASKATHRAHSFPRSPRIILRRIEEISPEYFQQLLQQDTPQAPSKPRRAKGM